MKAFSVTLSPFAKAVIAALVALVTLIAQCITNGVIDSASLITFLGGIGTVVGVYKATNKPSTNDTGTVG